MNRLKLSFLSLLLAGGMLTYGQTPISYKLGSIKEVKKSLSGDLRISKKAQKNGDKSLIEMKINSEESLPLSVNYQNETRKTFTLAGKVDSEPNSSFFLSIEGKNTRGHIVLTDKKKAYQYYLAPDKSLSIKEVDIDKVICIDYPELPKETRVAANNNSISTMNAKNVYGLESLPNAEACILLDFDGYSLPAGTGWLNGSSWEAPASGMSDSDILTTWNIISEDYRPYSVNVTTSETVFNSYSVDHRIRCAFTTDDTPYPGVGGIAYVGTFGYNDWPCWVFVLYGRYAGDAATHELGHTLGLMHDGRTNPEEEYYGGQGDWAPIMGVGYYKTITQWCKGEYNYANNTEDDLAIINGYINYRNDDYQDNISGATFISKDNSGILDATSGVIENKSDVDMFSFTCGSGNAKLDISNTVDYANLDISVSLYDGSTSNLINTFDDNGLNCSFNVTLNEGTYYLAIKGTGYGDPATNGYSEYGSLGSYTISGTVAPGGGTNSSMGEAVAMNTEDNDNVYSSNNTVDNAQLVLYDGSETEESLEPSFEIFPSVTNQSITLSGVPESAWISVYNLLGEKVIELKANSASPVINISKLESGSYYVAVHYSNKKETLKFIKE